MKKQRTDFSRCDLFGQTIAFTFKGYSDYRTVFGSVMSVACVVVFCVFFAVRAKSLLVGESAFMFVTEAHMGDEPFDLVELGYFFAV